MLQFITKFFKDISASVVMSQLVLVLLTAFGAGLFIRWQDTPAYWEWLQALSIITHATRGAMLSVMRKLTFECALAGDGNCYGPSGDLFPCDAGSYYASNTMCEVSGSTVLYITQNVPYDESYWKSFGYLVALFAGFRLSSMVLMFFPFEAIVFSIQKMYHSPELLSAILTSQLKIIQLEQRMSVLLGASRQSSPSAVTAYQPVATSDGTFSSSAAAAPAGGVSPPMGSPGTSSSSDRPSVKRGNSHTNHSAAPNLSKAADADSAAVDLPSQSTTRLAWKNLDLVLKKGGKKLIDNVSGSVRAGKVLALMGPSGAGKTTLLNALANRAPYANVTGAVTFAGLPLTSKDLMYVPQFDEIKGYTTVFQQIELVGLMKCSDQAAMRRRLLQLLQILGLFEKANVLCKDLSGGELKRVSVGMGMISSPKVLFLDEPTSGLDSTAA
jgi:ABC-type lipoprotein export system ATPase subunit